MTTWKISADVQKSLEQLDELFRGVVLAPLSRDRIGDTVTDLDARIRADLDRMEEYADRADNGATDGLRAVLDIHKPADDFGEIVCVACLHPHEHQMPYPCNTVRAIARALGVTDD